MPPLHTLKGVGPKTEALFARLGIIDTDSLIHYYPRTYDIYEAPAEIRSLEESTVAAITTTVADQTGRLPVTWFNMPYLRSTLKKGSVFVLRGRIIRKQGKLQMEHPEIFTPAAYEEILHSLQPIYALTSGLSNKTRNIFPRSTGNGIIWQTAILHCLPFIFQKICRS